MVKKQFLIAFQALLIITSVTGMLSTADARSEKSDTADIPTLSLQETIQVAKENSPLARTAQFALNASQYRFRSFRADLLPELSLRGDAPNYHRSFRENFNPDGTTSLIYTQQSNTSVELSVDQPLMATGGNLSVATGITRLGIFPNENTYLWSSTPLVLRYSQPLFQFNSLKWRNRLEPMRLEIAEKQYVEEMENLSYTVTQRYFDVLLAKVNLEIAEFNLTVNDSIYNISQGRYNVGSIAENDLLQSELALRNAEASLTGAQINYDQQLKSFRLLLGFDADAPIDVEVPDEMPEYAVEMQTALEMARLHNSTSLNFQLAEMEANRNMDQAVKQSSFTAVIHANYGLNQTSADFTDLYQDPRSQQFVTLNFQVPIFNWGKRQAEVQSARNTQRQVTNDVAYQQAQFDLQIQNAVDEFRQLRDQVLLAELSDGIADRRYQVARSRYQIGRIDITNLFIAQNERDAARRSYVQSLRNYWLALYNLRRLTLYDFENDQIIAAE